MKVAKTEVFFCNAVRTNWTFVRVTTDEGLYGWGEATLEGKEKAVEVDQPLCMFIPRTVAIREGQEVIVKNSSSINHNVQWIGNGVDNEGGNVTLVISQEVSQAGATGAGRKGLLKMSRKAIVCSVMPASQSPGSASQQRSRGNPSGHCTG